MLLGLLITWAVISGSILLAVIVLLLVMKPGPTGEASEPVEGGVIATPLPFELLGPGESRSQDDNVTAPFCLCGQMPRRSAQKSPSLCAESNLSGA